LAASIQLAGLLRQPDDLTVPTLNHFLEISSIAVPQLPDRVDADALEHVGMLGADTLDLGQVVFHTHDVVLS